MKKILCILATMIALAGCNDDTAPVMADYPPIPVSSDLDRGDNVVRALASQGVCVECFRFYRSAVAAKAFALAESGAYGFTFDKQNQAEASQGALDICRLRNPLEARQPCRLLMEGDRFVWE